MKCFYKTVQTTVQTQTIGEGADGWARRNTKIGSKRYIALEDKYADAFVASLLCQGGPIAYQQKLGVEIADY
jgi:hypothetical protein